MEAEDIIWLRADSWELRAKEWIRKNALKIAKKIIWSRLSCSITIRKNVRPFYKIFKI